MWPRAGKRVPNNWNATFTETAHCPNRKLPNVIVPVSRQLGERLEEIGIVTFRIDCSSVGMILMILKQPAIPGRPSVRYLHTKDPRQRGDFHENRNDSNH